MAAPQLDIKAYKLAHNLDFYINDTAKLARANLRFFNRCTLNLPHKITRRLAADYVKQYHSQTAKTPARAANIKLREQSKKLQSILRRCPLTDISALYNEQQQEKAADAAALYCVSLCKQAKHQSIGYHAQAIRAFKLIEPYLHIYDIEPQINERSTDFTQYERVLVRAINSDWWLKKIKRKAARTVEHVYIVAGYVKKAREEYASNFAVAGLKSRLAANAAYLQSMDVENIETGDRISLETIANKTTSNPKLRRLELMTRIRGMEEIANESGYQSAFITLTAPSKYHANSKKFIHCTPRDTHDYMCGQWAKARAEIGRQSIDWYGARVVEPHADATPHWHILAFVKNEQIAQLVDILKTYALEHDAAEKGAASKRFTVKYIDPSKGSAVGYIAKYIAKNVDAHEQQQAIDKKSHNNTLSESLPRVLSWSRLWAIRQFQFFGSASVSVYRELRRLKTPIHHDLAETIRQCADAGDWSAFTEQCQAINVALWYDETVNH